jgi:hypothetical protein
MQNLQYYQKYCKYKQKFIIFKQSGGDPLTDINNNLYIKFITENLVAFDLSEIEEKSVSIPLKTKKRRSDIAVEAVESEAASSSDIPSLKRSRHKPVKYEEYIEKLTPAIMDHLSPVSRDRMFIDIIKDDTIINKLFDDQKDSEYILYENYGKLIESWIADNMKCPCCKHPNSLRRYLSDSMPIIDLVCINLKHTPEDGVKFFQVKSSNGDPFLGKPYFNYDPISSTINPDANTIHVGSRTWGQHVHSISPFSSLFDKKILCGYICIQYTDFETILRIDPSNSMIVLPIYLLPAKRKLFDPSLYDESLSWYYKYVDNNVSHNRIQFNLNTNTIITGTAISDLLLSQLTIDKSYPIQFACMLNPLNPDKI